MGLKRALLGVVLPACSPGEAEVGEEAGIWTADAGDGVPVPPIVHADAVYAATALGRVFSWDLATGDERWSASLGAQLGGRIAVGEDFVYAGAGGDLVALRTSDGTEAWRTDTDDWGDRAALPVVGASWPDNVLAGWDAGLARCEGVDRAEGPTCAIVAATGGEPPVGTVAAGTVAIFGVGEGEVVVADAREATATETAVDGAIAVPPAAVDEDGSDDGFVAASDAGILYWIGLDGTVTGTVDPALGVPASLGADAGARTLVVSWEEVGLSGLDLDSADPSWFWAESLPISPIAVAQGRVWFGDSGGTVRALDAASGTEEWSVEVGETVDLEPAVGEGTVAFATTGGTVGAAAVE